MADYRLYLLDEIGHIQRAIEIRAEDDSEAIGVARNSLNGESGELWSLDRKVSSFGSKTRSPSRRSGTPEPGASTS